VLVVSACAPAAPDEELTVFAAASLRDVFRQLETAWLARHPDTGLTVAYEASNVLAAQIAEGAPADVFVSADTDRPRQLFEAGLVSGEPKPVARNGLALVAALDAAGVQAPADLADEGVRIVAAGPGVPITRYAEDALDQLAGTMAAPEAFLAAVAANIVSREDNVRAALAKVELGEGDVALVYHSDAVSSERVREIPLPGLVDISAQYAAVQVNPRTLAAEFVAWLAHPGSDAAAIFEASDFEIGAHD